jgi:hypothetical protein
MEDSSRLRSPTPWKVYNGGSVHIFANCNMHTAIDAEVIKRSANVLYLNFALLP